MWYGKGKRLFWFLIFFIIDTYTLTFLKVGTVEAPNKGHLILVFLEFENI